MHRQPRFRVRMSEAVKLRDIQECIQSQHVVRADASLGHAASYRSVNPACTPQPFDRYKARTTAAASALLRWRTGTIIRYYRSGLIDHCLCGASPATREHFLLRCSLTARETAAVTALLPPAEHSVHRILRGDDGPLGLAVDRLLLKARERLVPPSLEATYLAMQAERAAANERAALDEPSPDASEEDMPDAPSPASSPSPVGTPPAQLVPTPQAEQSSPTASPPRHDASSAGTTRPTGTEAAYYAMRDADSNGDDALLSVPRLRDDARAGTIAYRAQVPAFASGQMGRLPQIPAANQSQWQWQDPESDGDDPFF
ncbi:uncharacterized protein SRS1_11696 [Sporisorium reilianum f. sp. reilianum]|uniref:Uncharacterized protein n=1 Tax=Sporisorium reilianum f. sp. reilianum TaxID=72559 RepID=A0A2N8U6R8_9BASI|nr:uncharacterized protein SRS1_11696 [Sporisorium reilianum f. sp. reilianum]